MTVHATVHRSLGEAIANPDEDVRAQRKRLEELVSDMSSADDLPRIQWPLYGAMLSTLDHLGRLFDDDTTTREARGTSKDQDDD